MTLLLATTCRHFVNCGRLYFTRFPLCYKYNICIQQSKSLYAKEINSIVTVIVIYSVKSGSPLIFSSSCNSIRTWQHHPSLILKRQNATCCACGFDRGHMILKRFMQQHCLPYGILTERMKLIHQQQNK